jgi:hypothetical protein
MGLVNGDALSGAPATSAGGTSSVGSYAVTRGSLAGSGNYRLSYVPGTLAVTPRPITVTGNDVSRVYGDANPTLGFSVGGMGLVNGDALSGAPATSAGGTSSVGDYAVTRGSLTSSGNYQLSYVPGILSVTPRPILLTIEDSHRAFGQPNPQFAVTSGSTGLVNGDTVRGEPSTSAGLLSESGAYPINAGTLNVGPNYVPSILPGTLLVLPREVQRTPLLVREQITLSRDPEIRPLSEAPRTTFVSATRKASGDAGTIPSETSVGALKNVVDSTSPADRGTGTALCSDSRGSKAVIGGSSVANCDHGGQ